AQKIGRSAAVHELGTLKIYITFGNQKVVSDVSKIWLTLSQTLKEARKLLEYESQDNKAF
ncbi:hypothetical protein GB937_010178, partial [Aspergillus fischeri]